MDWLAEAKMLNKALKQVQAEKARLEASVANSDQDQQQYYTRQITKKELIIQNLESRIGNAKVKVHKDDKKV